MEKLILIALEKMEGKKFDSMKEALKHYTEDSLFQLWLNYEGIIGYTQIIKDVVNSIYKANI